MDSHLGSTPGTTRPSNGAFLGTDRGLFHEDLDLPWVILEGPWASEDGASTIELCKDRGVSYLVGTQAWCDHDPRTFLVKKFAAVPHAPTGVAPRAGPRRAVPAGIPPSWASRFEVPLRRLHPRRSQRRCSRRSCRTGPEDHPVRPPRRSPSPRCSSRPSPPRRRLRRRPGHRRRHRSGPGGRRSTARSQRGRRCRRPRHWPRPTSGRPKWIRSIRSVRSPTSAAAGSSRQRRLPRRALPPRRASRRRSRSGLPRRRASCGPSAWLLVSCPCSPLRSCGGTTPP